MKPNAFVVVVVESMIGSAPSLDLLRRSGLGEVGEYFSPSAIAASGLSLKDYAADVVQRCTTPNGVFSTVIRASDAARFPLRKGKGALAVEPRYLFLRQPDALLAAAEAYVEQALAPPDGRGSIAPPTPIAMPDLTTVRCALARAAVDRSLIPLLFGPSGPGFLEIGAAELLDDPGRTLGRIFAFAGLGAPATIPPLDLGRGSDERAIAAAVAAHSKAMSRPVAWAPRDLAPDDPGRVALVMTVKDEEDIIFPNLSWHFGLGLRQFLILDNQSSDGVRAEIARFTRACEPLGARILVVDDREPRDPLGRQTTAAAHMAQSHFGADWIIALAPDEFLYLERGEFFDVISRCEEELEQRLGLSPRSPLFLAALQFPLIDHFCTALDRPAEANPTARLAFRWRKPRPGSKVGSICAARWSSDLRFGRRNQAETADGGAVPAMDAGPHGAHVRRFQVRSFDHFVDKVRAAVGPPGPAQGEEKWASWRQLLERDGEGALREVFEHEFQLSPSELLYDPLPGVVIERKRVFIDRKGRRPPLNFPLRGRQLIAIGGVPFEPEMISLRAPPVPRPLFLRANSSDIPTFMQVFVQKDYDIEFPSVPKYILDLGANIGLAAAYFIGRFPDASIACVEPDEENYKMLLANIEGYAGVSALHAAVWPEAGRLQMVHTNEAGGSLGFWGVRTRPMPEGADAAAGAGGVPALTIPDIMRRAGFPRIDLLKVDIEGAELELFSRNTQDWLPSVGHLVIETHDRFKPGATAAVQAAMGGLDYDQRRMGENLVFIRRRPQPAPAAANAVAADGA